MNANRQPDRPPPGKVPDARQQLPDDACADGAARHSAHAGKDHRRGAIASREAAQLIRELEAAIAHSVRRQLDLALARDPLPWRGQPPSPPRRG